MINNRSSSFATFAAKHQSRGGSFSVERGNAFYTIYIFYTAIIGVGPRSGCFRADAETGAAMLDYTGNEMTIPFATK